MKKILLLLIIGLFFLIPVFSASPRYSSDGDSYRLDPEGWWNELWTDARFSYDIYLRSTLLRGDYSVGGGLSLGVTTNRFRFEGYAQGDYFLAPMGNGYLSPLEFDVESGITLGWKMLEVGRFDVYIADKIS